MQEKVATQKGGYGAVWCMEMESVRGARMHCRFIGNRRAWEPIIGGPSAVWSLSDDGFLGVRYTQTAIPHYSGREVKLGAMAKTGRLNRDPE